MLAHVLGLLLHRSRPREGGRSSTPRDGIQPPTRCPGRTPWAPILDPGCEEIPLRSDSTRSHSAAGLAPQSQELRGFACTRGSWMSFSLSVPRAHVLLLFPGFLN